jgi:hypothetical protein
MIEIGRGRRLHGSFIATAATDEGRRHADGEDQDDYEPESNQP